MTPTAERLGAAVRAVPVRRRASHREALLEYVPENRGAVVAGRHAVRHPVLHWAAAQRERPRLECGWKDGDDIAHVVVVSDPLAGGLEEDG